MTIEPLWCWVRKLFKWSILFISLYIQHSGHLLRFPKKWIFPQTLRLSSFYPSESCAWSQRIASHKTELTYRGSSQILANFTGKLYFHDDMHYIYLWPLVDTMVLEVDPLLQSFGYMPYVSLLKESLHFLKCHIHTYNSILFPINLHYVFCFNALLLLSLILLIKETFFLEITL